jgi:hypothetical protein
VEDLRRWLSKEIWAPLGQVPVLNIAGEIAPVSNEVPNSWHGFPFLEDADIQFPSDWEHGTPRVINVVEFKYKRFYRDQSQDNWVAEVPVSIVHRNEESVRRFGEIKQTFDTAVFNAIGFAVDPGILGGGPPGDSAIGVENETGHIMARERYDVVRTRYIHGAQGMSVLVKRSSFPDLSPGDWIRPKVSWLPNLLTGLRGSDALAQVVSASDYSCTWLAVELEAIPVTDEMVTMPAMGVITPFEGSVEVEGEPVYGTLLDFWPNNYPELGLAVWRSDLGYDPETPMFITYEFGKLGLLYAETGGQCGIELGWKMAYVDDLGNLGEMSPEALFTNGCL